jgi:DNA-binding CsgD family transcriptional regulator
VFIAMLLYSIKLKTRQQKIFTLGFAIILIVLVVLRSGSMHFSGSHIIIGLYFMLLFFAGNLSLILLTKVYLARFGVIYQQNKHITEDLFEKYHISKREKQIIAEICKGKTNQQIADELFITLQTVKDHTHNIYKKTEVKNRVQLTQVFSQQGLSSDS